MQTPYYLIDKTKLRRNLEIVATLREKSGAKALLALKCFATWSVFDLMREYLDGTTSSSLNEVRLGQTRFGGETHAYSVAYSEREFDEVAERADKVIFNSASQLNRFAERTAKPRGLRLNPGVSSSSFDLADPARPFSRLGENELEKIESHLHLLDGFMIHNNCENSDFDRFDALLTSIEEKYGSLFAKVNWVSLGGGIHFTGEGYPLERLSDRLKAFSDEHGVQVYLEPGEACVTRSTSLETSVLDVLENGKRLAIVDSSIEAHMLDLLIYRETAKVAEPEQGETYVICGKSCLAGDIFGEFKFEKELSVGDRVSIRDAGGYTMVKKNWFNGVDMPAIVVRELDGSDRVVRAFDYNDYERSLS